MPAPETITFPHAAQVFLVERYVADLRGPPPPDSAGPPATSPDPVTLLGLRI